MAMIDMIAHTADRKGLTIILDTPHECPACRTFTQFYCQLEGRTYCYVCAPRKEE